MYNSHSISLLIQDLVANYNLKILEIRKTPEISTYYNVVSFDRAIKTKEEQDDFHLLLGSDITNHIQSLSLKQHLLSQDLVAQIMQLTPIRLLISDNWKTILYTK